MEEEISSDDLLDNLFYKCFQEIQNEDMYLDTDQSDYIDKLFSVIFDFLDENRDIETNLYKYMKTKIIESNDIEFNFREHFKLYMETNFNIKFVNDYTFNHIYGTFSSRILSFLEDQMFINNFSDEKYIEKTLTKEINKALYFIGFKKYLTIKFISELMWQQLT